MKALSGAWRPRCSGERNRRFEIGGAYAQMSDHINFAGKTLTASFARRGASTTSALVVNSQIGYTGSGESREDMLQNTHFVDAEVELLAKYGSVQWKSLAKYTVARRLLTKTPS